jgi:hypothetical protein
MKTRCGVAWWDLIQGQQVNGKPAALRGEEQKTFLTTTFPIRPAYNLFAICLSLKTPEQVDLRFSAQGCRPFGSEK